MSHTDMREDVWRKFFPPRLYNILFALSLSGILAYSGALAFYMLTNFDLINIIRDVNNDDSFYYYKTAQYLAEGFFSTFDGGITRTNGYHPIWLFLITPIYWAIDSESALFAIKALEIMLVGGGAVLIVLAGRLSHLPSLVLLVSLVPAHIYQAGDGWGFLGLLGGMEAAASLFWLGLLFISLSLFERSPERWTWLLAAAVFTLPWVRLELAAVSVSATAALCFIKWLDYKMRPACSWRGHLTILLGAWSGILLNFVYNRVFFGGFVPVSGMVKSKFFSTTAWDAEGGYNMFNNFQETLEIPIIRDGLGYSLLIGGIILSMWLLATLAGRKRAISTRPPMPRSFMVGAFGLAVGHLAKVVQSILTMHPSDSKYLWYYVPAYLMETLIVPIICFAAMYVIRLFFILQSFRTASLLNMGVATVGATLLVLKTDYLRPFDYVDWRVQSTEVGNTHMGSYPAVQVMNRILPKGSVIGSTDAGVVGYFSIFPVVNLDGLMNSYDYFRVLSRAGRVNWEEATLKYGLTHWANSSRNWVPSSRLLYESFLEVEPWEGWPDPKFFIATESPTESPFDFWSRIKPFFAWQSGRMAAIVTDRRLVQVFVRDCTPEDVPDLFIFSWNLDGLPKSEARLWVQPRRNHLGYCLRTFILPISATPDIGIEATTPEEFVKDVQPHIRSVFDVYLRRNSLFYVKAPCTQADLDLPFFLSVFPVDSKDLPDHRKQWNWDNLSFFPSLEHGRETRGSCVAVRQLPQYAISAIFTGQETAEGNRVWEGYFDLRE